MATLERYDFLRDPEYGWLFRTCTNVFNICLTMTHLTISENIIMIQIENDIRNYYLHVFFNNNILSIKNIHAI